MEDGSENYCTLCGDGGEMVCCDFCEKSLCKACIRRVSGEAVVERLLDDDITEWKCYVCDPSPLTKEQKTCADLCNYYKRMNPKAKRLLVFQGAVSGGDSGRDNRGGGSGSSGRGDGNNGSGRGDGNNGSGRGNGKNSSRRGDGNNGSGRGDGKSNSGRGNGKNSSGRGDGKNSSGHGSKGSLKKTSGGGASSQEASWSSRGKKHQAPGGSDSGSEDSSSAESPEVQTDDVSMSDSDHLSELAAGRRKRRRRFTSASNGSETGDDPQMKQEEASPLEGGGDSIKKKPSSKKRLQNFTLLDSDSDFESPAAASSPARKKRCNLSTTSSGEDSDVIVGPAKKRAKKSRLAGILSSASDSEDESPQKYQLEFSNSNGGIEGGFDLSESETSPASDSSIKYATRKGGSGSDSDSDVVLQGRKKKGAGQRRVISDRESDSADEAVRTKPARRRGRKPNDDFQRDFSRLGPRIRKRKVKKTVLGSSSSSENEEETKEGAEGAEEEEGSGEEHSQEASQDKGTPGRKRKKIRKLIVNAKLDEKTREAQRLERERMDRLKKKAKSATNVSDCQRLILEQDSGTKEVQVEVRHSLLERLLPHQRQGIKFLYDSCVESLERLRSGQKSGAILAHCMGLGKTVQVCF